MELTIRNSFDEFWAICPRKTDRKKAEIAFNKLSEPDRFNCIQGMKHHTENNPQWRDKSLIPHPTTFINGRRWEDEIVKDAKTETIDQTAKSEAHMVWSAMTQMYGKTWHSFHGPAPTPVWIQQLKGMPMHRLKRGLQMTRDSGTEFPPTLPKFLQYCGPRLEEIEPARSLPAAPKTERQEALQHLEGIKKMLGAG